MRTASAFNMPGWGAIAFLLLFVVPVPADEPQPAAAPAAPRAVGAGGASARPTITRTLPQPISRANPSVTAASGSSTAAPVSPRSTGRVITGPLINGTNVANRVPAAATRVGNGPGVVVPNASRSAAVRTPFVQAPLLATAAPVAAVPVSAVQAGALGANGNPNTGGVPVNRGPGVPINPGYGNGGLSRTAPIAPGPNFDPNAPWVRRYQDRAIQDPYAGWPPTYYDPGYGYGRYPYGYGYGYGAYGPVFIDAGTNYVFGPQIANNYGDLAQLPMQQPAAPHGEDRDDDRDAARGRNDRPDQPPAAANARDRKPRGAGISPEKLHDLMIEGVQLFKVGKYNEAASKFLRVTLADRQNIDATLAYAVARFATGDYGIAGLAVRRAVRRMPEVVDSKFDVRSRYEKAEDFANHLARLEQYVVDNSEDADAWIVLGFVRHFSGQRELAAETFRRLETVPDADLEVAGLFLAAGTQAPQTRPAAVAPIVLPTADRPLPEARLAAAEELISVE